MPKRIISAIYWDNDGYVTGKNGVTEIKETEDMWIEVYMKDELYDAFGKWALDRIRYKLSEK